MRVGLAVKLAAMDRSSSEAKESLLDAAQAHIANTPFPAEFKTKGKCNHWTFRPYIIDAKNATVKHIIAAEPGYFGVSLARLQWNVMMCAGQPQPNVLEGPAEDSPLLFADKEVLEVNISNAFMEGAGAVPYTYCEVYAPQELNTFV